ncbi:hypothetical protein [uncultured Tenacibaculum sp.]|uniref:hypothetical protein n=1 Tax=uncultured Tenacibaculum sp. TaxID=174713 RepID=UPI002623EDD7|nr:hypothetical protein [uncultured Tenacibaculum sp.]
MLPVYHRVKVNSELLEPDNISIDPQNPTAGITNFLRGHVITTLPAGKVVGVTYNPYQLQEIVIPNPGGGIVAPRLELPYTWSQTDISILDSKKRKVTEPTDISDFRHKSGGHTDGFKNIHMDNTSDAVIRIEWETIGRVPICGEFVFLIEQDDCECKL